MKSKKKIILTETGVIVLLMIVFSYLAVYILPKILFFFSWMDYIFSNMIYYTIIIIYYILILLILLRLVYHKNKKADFLFIFNFFRFKKLNTKTLYRAILIFLISGTLSNLIRVSLEYFKISPTIIKNLELVKSSEINVNDILITLSILVTVVVAPLVEEIIFRGYLLQKQEIALGKYAWILNGFAFTLVHLVVYNFATLLIISPFSFLIAYKVQKHKDTSIGLLSHFFINLLFVIRLFME